MKDIFHQESFSEICKENSKLRTYSLIKNTIGNEKYLNKIENIQERISLAKFRLSNHELMIEKGRHLKIERHCRLCPFCPEKVEDEMHFLLDCKCFSKLRMELFEKTYQKIPSFPYHINAQKFVILMTDSNIIPVTAKYIFKMMELRNSLMENHKTNE